MSEILAWSDVKVGNFSKSATSLMKSWTSKPDPFIASLASKAVTLKLKIVFLSSVLILESKDHCLSIFSKMSNSYCIKTEHENLKVTFNVTTSDYKEMIYGSSAPVSVFVNERADLKKICLFTISCWNFTNLSFIFYFHLYCFSYLDMYRQMWYEL